MIWYGVVGIIALLLGMTFGFAISDYINDAKNKGIYAENIRLWAENSVLRGEGND